MHVMDSDQTVFQDIFNTFLVTHYVEDYTNEGLTIFIPGGR